VKQETFEGIAPIAISELTELAEKYEAKHDARIKLLAEELVLKAELLVMMDSYKLQVYRDGDLVVTKTYKENIKCKREDNEEETTDDND